MFNNLSDAKTYEKLFSRIGKIVSEAREMKKRGRPRKRPEDRHEKSLTVRMTQAAWDELQKRIEECKMGQTDYIITCLNLCDFN